MMLLVGLFIIPIILLIINKLNSFDTSKFIRILLNVLMIGIVFLFFYFTFKENKEPFSFEIIRLSDYLLYSLVILLFTPFIWIVIFYYLRKLFKNIKINRNFKFKNKNEFTYYRDDLDKLSPSIVMFTSFFDTDIKASITSVILKLKVCGYIKNDGDKYVLADGDDSSLLESEKLVLKSLGKKSFDENKYKNLVEKEAVKHGFVHRNKTNIFIKIIKLLILIVIPVSVYISSVKFDKYVYANYKTYVKDGIRFINIGEDGKECSDVHFGTIDNVDDYYHGYIKEYDGTKIDFYDKCYIRADKYDIKQALLTEIYQLLDLGLIVLFFVILFMCITLFIQELVYINKSYRRTIKGNNLVNKSYGLKNFLNEFSLIKYRSENEIILWEYYLIYATCLKVNTDICDEIINKYFKK